MKRLSLKTARWNEISSSPGVRLALVAIANSLDLTERMLPALKCRGVTPELVCFPAYSKTQVQSILSTTLGQLPFEGRIFEESALELVARCGTLREVGTGSSGVPFTREVPVNPSNSIFSNLGHRTVAGSTGDLRQAFKVRKIHPTHPMTPEDILPNRTSLGPCSGMPDCP